MDDISSSLKRSHSSSMSSDDDVAADDVAADSRDSAPLTHAGASAGHCWSAADCQATDRRYS
eukprot:CAMPEP_0180222432 /NCGR_PEP_ID=MMETSP0987-20121128/20721_1 /TAXON_ID=697907 /ORGANISM="non described non described, Strain CCMP2293" /LENGTH=61 /DNA_ID=CAMNT_0022184547 /DNA_START=504 /DNA_END=686 /DNA_ORIENTATION=+